MTLSYLLIQAIGFAGTIVFFLSFQCRSNKNLFRVQFLSYVCYIVHLLLLGAMTGGMSYMLNAFRSFCLGSSNEKLKSWRMCACICAMQLVVLALTWESWISILPIVANLASTIAGYTKNARKIRIAGIFINSPLWIVYNVIVGSWAGILDEVVSELSMIISIIRFGWKELDRVED
ncbi:MAG: YgjV family protein [Firmicutes bacterium]|nr:YgjV family protein [Bacillota bacterium]